MCPVLNSAWIWSISQADLQGFHSFVLSCNPASFSIHHSRIPAICLHMSLIYNVWIFDTFLKRTWCTSRSFSTFFYQTDLNSFHPLAHSFSSGLCSIFRPTKPAICLHMGAIINIIFLCHFTGQLNLNCFHLLTYSCCSSHSSVTLPALPANILNMCPVLDSAWICNIFQTNLQGFHSFVLSCNPPSFSVKHSRIPTICLHMGLVYNIWNFSTVFKRARCTSRNCSSFCHQTDLDSLYSLTISGCSCTFTIFCPAKPAVCLHMYPVINVVFGCHLIC